MYVLNIDKNTQRVLSITSIDYMSSSAGIVIEELPGHNITDYIWDGEALIYQPRDKIESIPVESEENPMWSIMAEAIREGVNAL